eukprot:Hpha_TRINITY_DN12727_c0_g1::TRINITY_DN12727_c0_g1_i2::g.114132::m.114132/K07750/E1.14.13.72, SC4MOL, ERG25; methylsterol monooxygenase
MVTTMTVHAVMYFGMNSFFHYCDSTGVFSQYKLPRTERMRPPPGLLRRTLLEAVLGQFLVGPPVIYFGYMFLISEPRPGIADPLPDVLSMFHHFVCAVVSNEVLFYAVHRLFHEIPFLYRFHKQHHTYVGSIGFAAEYAHPLEQVLANQGPTCLYMGLAYPHPLVWLCWLGYRLILTYEHHSGYCFKGSLLWKVGLTNAESVEIHDHHHTSNKGSYGHKCIDWVCGTLDTFIMEKYGKLQC